ncbi:alkaline phosphatase family protein [Phenylobacterium sp.]|uniref:alkaline phosphatase family protein n=1 Tax=Phenylobacterium sp. TaxID=1871053 RepID=UPI003BAB349D
MLRRVLALAGVLSSLMVGGVATAADLDRRLLLVTLDGLSWREVFRGADPERAADPQFSHEPADMKAAFVDPADRPRALMPFLHNVIAKDGVLLGDRDHGDCMAVANDQWFSYPGYNELLTGRPDPAITSNEHGPNRNVTFLEWLNRQPGFAGRVQAVTSWDRYDDILNVARSGLPVNDGWKDAPTRTPAERTIAQLQAGAPRIWSTVRLDVFTHAYALETLRREKPRVLYVAYGETDDFAHDGRYDLTLDAARRADAFIAELWRTLQADPAYAGKTTLIVTTDHGRAEGKPDAWKNHGRPDHPGSDGTWIAVMGPGVTKPKPVSGASCGVIGQTAATALTALGLDWKAFDPTAAPPLDVLGH